MNAMPADWGRTASRWGRSRRTAPVVPPPGAPRPAAFCARARMSSRKSQPGGPPCEVADSATRYPVLVGPSLSRRCSRGGSVGKRISLLTCCAVLALLGSTSRLRSEGGVIRGRVTDSTGAALGRVSVTIEALGARATTDDHGNYELRSVPAGSHTVRVRLLGRSEEHTSELQSRLHLVCRLLLEKKKKHENDTLLVHTTTIERIKRAY